MDFVNVAVTKSYLTQYSMRTSGAIGRYIPNDAFAWRFVMKPESVYGDTNFQRTLNISSFEDFVLSPQVIWF